MLKLKVLLTKMAEMLKNLSDNKIDMTSPIYNYNENAGNDSDDYNLQTAINSLNWIDNIATDSNHNKISVKKMFTKILNQIKINADNINNITGKRIVATTSGGSPRAGNTYFNDTTSYDKWLYVYQQKKLITFQGIITGKTSSKLLKDQYLFMIPANIAPSETIYVPAIYQKVDGTISAWRVEVNPVENDHSYAYIKPPLNYLTNNSFLRVMIFGSWMAK